MRPHRLLVRRGRDDLSVTHGDPLPRVVLQIPRGQGRLLVPALGGALFFPGLVLAHTSAAPVLWYFRIPSAARYASAPTVPVGLNPAFCGKLHAPTTNTFGASHIWR